MKEKLGTERIGLERVLRGFFRRFWIYWDLWILFSFGFGSWSIRFSVLGIG